MPTSSARTHPGRASTRTGTTRSCASRAARACGSTSCWAPPPSPPGRPGRSSTGRSARAREPATTPPLSSSSPTEKRPPPGIPSQARGPPGGGRDPLGPCSGGDQVVRVEDVLAGRALVELLVTARGVVERDDRGPHVLRDLHPVVQDRHHQLPVVAHHRALTGVEGVRLGPAEAEPDGQRPDLRRLVARPRV